MEDEDRARGTGEGIGCEGWRGERARHVLCVCMGNGEMEEVEDALRLRLDNRGEPRFGSVNYLPSLG